MARRKKKQTVRRKQPFNIAKAAESLIIANAASRMTTGTNIIPFLTEGWLTKKTPGAQGGAGNSWTFSAAELIQGIIPGGESFGQSSNYPGANSLEGVLTAMKYNFTTNAATQLPIVLLAPAAFKLGGKVLARPRRSANRLLKMAGLGREVRV